ncbi:hypothetical protein INR49_002767 [Caranx melampygus]|nr:hypothetical protein INR49_002807 [Caranx melampygus]KAG7235344.1 hypothetical protein INR49_002767 [Caranx melampygus]
MFNIWIKLSLLLSGVRAFVIQNTQSTLCLEDSTATGEVLLKKCNLDSMNQQWVLTTQGKLMCVATSRCLSAQPDPVQTLSCHIPESERLLWDCDRDRLISRSMTMLLSIDGQHVSPTDNSKQSKWRSLDEGDICQEKLRLRRAYDDPDEFQDVEGHAGESAVISDDQRKYLRWYYRKEDPTIWNFVLLGLSFVCLLVGFLLLGMGAMANKSRKKIAQYKAAASLIKKNGNEELPLRDNCNSNREVNKLRPGDIVVTWKDVKTSCLYSDPAPLVEQQEEQLKEEIQKEMLSAAELSSSYEVMAME